MFQLKRCGSVGVIVWLKKKRNWHKMKRYYHTDYARKPRPTGTCCVLPWHKIRWWLEESELSLHHWRRIFMQAEVTVDWGISSYYMKQDRRIFMFHRPDDWFEMPVAFCLIQNERQGEEKNCSGFPSLRCLFFTVRTNLLAQVFPFLTRSLSIRKHHPLTRVKHNNFQIKEDLKGSITWQHKNFQFDTF